MILCQLKQLFKLYNLFILLKLKSVLMVICKFYQNGNCRFGAKCANEHFDVKQLLKNEIEAAVKGSQWPLSSFGPFKEKANFPNFIEDQSFEEIRHLCYEAKKQNYFPNFEQQFNQQIIDARNKMQTLLSLNREVIDIVTAIYDGNIDSANSTNSNPFATMRNGATTSQQSTSFFGNNNHQQNAVNPFSKQGTATSGGFGNGTNIFSNATGTSGIISQSSFGNSIFSATNQQQQPQSTVFSTSQPTQQQQSFGTFNVQQSSSNIFAQSSTQQNNNVFGGQMQPFGASLFSQPKLSLPQPVQNNNNNNNNLFGQTGNNIFTQVVQPQQSQQVSQQPPLTQQANSFNAFASQTSAFSTQQPHMQQPFGQQTTGLFGNQQNVPVIQPQTQPNFFAQQVTPQNNTPQLFSSNSIIKHFDETNNVQNQQQNSSNNQLPPNITQQPTTHLSTTAYSKVEKISPEDLEAFKADNFTLENLPCIPPPRELC